MNTPQLLGDLKNHDIIVMPGYVGIGEKDRPVLLGNGGADMTAIYVAQQLGVKALLLKDIDGVYEHDPRESGPEPNRYSHISWDDAISISEHPAFRFTRQLDRRRQRRKPARS
jgi:homoserine dehydrogenase